MMRVFVAAAVVLAAGCSSAVRISELQTGPISQGEQIRLVATCESILHANGQTAEACPNVVEGTVWRRNIGAAATSRRTSSFGLFCESRASQSPSTT